MAVALYNNPPIHPEYFQPSKFEISNITYGISTTITMLPATVGGTTVYPNYVVGQLVRIVIPMPYGSNQLDGQEAYVTSIPTSTSVVINIDSRLYNPFNSSPGSNTPPQIMAIGDVNTGQINTSGRTSQNTYIPGSFINISPL